MSVLTNKNILLGITGGIAAYKCAELVRRLRDGGANVRVAMTPAATRFITPLTMQAVSGERVHTELLDTEAEAGMGHIELARWADLVVVAPATADFMARMAIGMANDLLATLCLATNAPIYLAPAMNSQMYQHPASQENLTKLVGRGVTMLGPDSGDLACGEVGPGRMLDPDKIIAALEARTVRPVLVGKRVLITLGPTREPIDPVRYITNRSSGKMGYAIADAARRAGAEVCIVRGPVSERMVPGAEQVAVETAAQMHQEVMARAGRYDLFIATAAVSDYTPQAPADEKLKKQQAEMALALSRTKDILADVAALSHGPFTVGFAAETRDVQSYALGKLRDKKLDMIVANQVGDGRAFDQDDNALSIFWPPDGHVELAQASKVELADKLIPIIADRLNAPG
jgi:phosphopantothenoylcysteine decarboxylase/phosphopantothenate--cysteine ligase